MESFIWRIAPTIFITMLLVSTAFLLYGFVKFVNSRSAVELAVGMAKAEALRTCGGDYEKSGDFRR